MTYSISGTPIAPLTALFAMADDGLAAIGAGRETAGASEQLIPLHHFRHDVATPCRNAAAIPVRETQAALSFVDRTAPVFAGWPPAPRGFDAGGMPRDVRLCAPGEADRGIRTLFERTDIAYINAHEAAHGRFAARIDRKS